MQRSSGTFRRSGTISIDSAIATTGSCVPSAGPVGGSPAADRPWPAPPHDHGSVSNQASGSSARRSADGPSFLIRGSQASQPGSSSPAGWSTGQPRLDRINSADLLRRARQIYFDYLSSSAAAAEPLGLVLHGAGGRVVFELPVLLPEELFVPIDWVRNRLQSRARGSRGGSPGRPAFS